MANGAKKKRLPPRHSWGAFGNQIIVVLIVFMLLSAGYSFIAEYQAPVERMPLSELAAELNAGRVKSISVAGNDLAITLTDGGERSSVKEGEAALSESLANYGVKPEALAKVSVEVQQPSGLMVWAATLLPIVVPILFVLVLFWFVSRQLRGASAQAFSFGQSRARITDPNDQKQKITFKDVAGAREAKEELTEIVDFLKNPKKFLDIGARIPKGVLLMGAPGTGKTLLARAVAGEAHVPFFYISGSEFVEMFVGVGASRVRDLFTMAKRAAPSIIFIDEIDAIGRHRGAGLGGGNDEREQTLNQILVEMDGFEPTEKLIVMAATNRPDVLDPALLRPGRFDRRVVIDLPDLRDREEILGIHAKNKPLAEDVNLHVVAERTPGFSGADLANLVNEGAILAAREDRSTVAQYDLIRSIEKVMLGPERRSHILSQKEKKITAYHEMGHALVASVLAHADPVHKVSIISRGHAAGYTLKLPLEERKLQSRKEFLDDLAVSLGGFAAERAIFHDVTTGASNDIQVATALARNMVTRYGMSEAVGPVAVEGGSRSLSEQGLFEKIASESIAATVDAEVGRMMREALTRAEKVLAEHADALEHLSQELIRVETLERSEFETLLIAHGITPKKIEDGIDVAPASPTAV